MFLNPFFIIMILFGSSFYIAKDEKKITQCSMMSNQYDELYQIIYLMILIGYFQSVFYLYRFCMATKRIK